MSSIMVIGVVNIMCKNCEKGYKCRWHNVGGIKGNIGIGGLGRGKTVISQRNHSKRLTKIRQEKAKAKRKAYLSKLGVDYVIKV